MDENLARQMVENTEKTAPVKFDQEPQAQPQPAQVPAAPVSLGRSESAKQADMQLDEMPIAGEIGWKMMPTENLPSQGRFYPEGAEVGIRAATVAEIRHFSTIDENDPLDMDDKLNMVMDKCVQMKFSGRRGSWRDVKEEDRFFLLFAVRDLTFKNGENRLYVTVRCGATCKGDGTFFEKLELKSENFDYYKLDDKLMNFYDPVEGAFVITHPSVGTVTLYVPSLGVTTFIKNYVRERMAKGERYDRAFVKMSPFLFGDWRTLNDAVYKKMEADSLGWGVERLSLILRAIEMIRFGVRTQIVRSCDKCGAEVAAPLTFPGGVKSLFLITDPIGGLL